MDKFMPLKWKNKKVARWIFILLICSIVTFPIKKLSNPSPKQPSCYVSKITLEEACPKLNYFFSPTSDIAISDLNSDRPHLPDSIISSHQHFVIHYTTRGDDAVALEDTNANSIPDRVEKIAEAFEKSYSIEIDQMNYQLPPSFEGGKKPYDIYIINLVNNYAITITEDVDSTTWEQKNVSSYILFDNDFIGAGYHIQGDDAIKITAAHEFFHAIQLGYVFRKSDSYFFELTAVWMEDQVFDEIDNYLYYLDYFFSAPDIPLNGVSFTVPGIFKHIYGSCIFAFYITENFGHDAIRQIWQRMPDQTAIEITNDFFKQHNSNFESEFVKFSMWNFFTGNRSIPFYCYDESQKYPEIAVKKDTIIDYYNEQTGAGYFLTAAYCVFHPFETSEYNVFLSTDVKEHWRLGIAVYDENTITTYSIQPGKMMNIGEVVNGQTILVVPCNVDRFTNPAHVYLKEKPERYTFILQKKRKVSPTLVKPFQIHKIFPNPFSGAVTFSIEKIADAPLTIRIFNIQGQQVDRMVIDQLHEEHNLLTWQPYLANKHLPSGIYFCQFSATRFVETKKIVLYR